MSDCKAGCACPSCKAVRLATNLTVGALEEGARRKRSKKAPRPGSSSPRESVRAAVTREPVRALPGPTRALNAYGPKVVATIIDAEVVEVDGVRVDAKATPRKRAPKLLTGR